MKWTGPLDRHLSGAIIENTRGLRQDIDTLFEINKLKEKQNSRFMDRLIEAEDRLVTLEKRLWFFLFGVVGTFVGLGLLLVVLLFFYF